MRSCVVVHIVYFPRIAVPAIGKEPTTEITINKDEDLWRYPMSLVGMAVKLMLVSGSIKLLKDEQRYYSRRCSDEICLTGGIPNECIVEGKMEPVSRRTAGW